MAALGLMYLMGSWSNKAGCAVIADTGLNRHTWEFQIFLWPLRETQPCWLCRKPLEIDSPYPKWQQVHDPNKRNMDPLHIILSLRYLAWQRKATHRDLREIWGDMAPDKTSWLMERGLGGREGGEEERLEPPGAVAQHLLVPLCWVVCACAPSDRCELVRCQNEPWLSRNNKKKNKLREKKVNNPQALGPFWLAIFHPSLQTTCATTDCKPLQIC